MMKLLIVVLGLGLVTAALYAADLSALAKREKERRRVKQGAPTRVYTNEDLERYEYRRTAEVEPRRAQRASRPARDFAKEEAHWRGEKRRHDRELAKLDAQIRRLSWRLRERELKRRPGERLRPDPSATLIKESIESLEDERRRLDHEFHERARKAGALPGWLR